MYLLEQKIMRQMSQMNLSTTLTEDNCHQILKSTENNDMDSEERQLPLTPIDPDAHNLRLGLPSDQILTPPPLPRLLPPLIPIESENENQISDDDWNLCGGDDDDISQHNRVRLVSYDSGPASKRIRPITPTNKNGNTEASNKSNGSNACASDDFDTPRIKNKTPSEPAFTTPTDNLDKNEDLQTLSCPCTPSAPRNRNVNPSFWNDENATPQPCNDCDQNIITDDLNFHVGAATKNSYSFRRESRVKNAIKQQKETRLAICRRRRVSDVNLCSLDNPLKTTVSDDEDFHLMLPQHTVTNAVSENQRRRQQRRRRWSVDGDGRKINIKPRQRIHHIGDHILDSRGHRSVADDTTTAKAIPYLRMRLPSAVNNSAMH